MSSPYIPIYDFQIQSALGVILDAHMLMLRPINVGVMIMFNERILNDPI